MRRSGRACISRLLADLLCPLTTGHDDPKKRRPDSRILHDDCAQVPPRAIFENVESWVPPGGTGRLGSMFSSLLLEQDRQDRLSTIPSRVDRGDALHAEAGASRGGVVPLNRVGDLSTHAFARLLSGVVFRNEWEMGWELVERWCGTASSSVATDTERANYWCFPFDRGSSTQGYHVGLMTVKRHLDTPLLVLVTYCGLRCAKVAQLQGLVAATVQSKWSHPTVNPDEWCDLQRLLLQVTAVEWCERRYESQPSRALYSVLRDRDFGGELRDFRASVEWIPATWSAKAPASKEWWNALVSSVLLRAQRCAIANIVLLRRSPQSGLRGPAAAAHLWLQVFDAEDGLETNGPLSCAGVVSTIRALWILLLLSRGTSTLEEFEYVGRYRAVVSWKHLLEGDLGASCETAAHVSETQPTRSLSQAAVNEELQQLLWSSARPNQTIPLVNPFRELQDVAALLPEVSLESSSSPIAALCHIAEGVMRRYLAPCSVVAISQQHFANSAPPYYPKASVCVYWQFVRLLSSIGHAADDVAGAVEDDLLCACPEDARVPYAASAHEAASRAGLHSLPHAAAIGGVGWMAESWHSLTSSHRLVLALRGLLCHTGTEGGEESSEVPLATAGRFAACRLSPNPATEELIDFVRAWPPWIRLLVRASADGSGRLKSHMQSKVDVARCTWEHLSIVCSLVRTPSGAAVTRGAVALESLRWQVLFSLLPTLQSTSGEEEGLIAMEETAGENIGCDEEWYDFAVEPMAFGPSRRHVHEYEALLARTLAVDFPLGLSVEGMRNAALDLLQHDETSLSTHHEPSSPSVLHRLLGESGMGEYLVERVTVALLHVFWHDDALTSAWLAWLTCRLDRISRLRPLMVTTVARWAIEFPPSRDTARSAALGTFFRALHARFGLEACRRLASQDEYVRQSFVHWQCEAAETLVNSRVVVLPSLQLRGSRCVSTGGEGGEGSAVSLSMVSDYRRKGIGSVRSTVTPRTLRCIIAPDAATPRQATEDGALQDLLSSSSFVE